MSVEGGQFITLTEIYGWKLNPDYDFKTVTLVDPKTGDIFTLKQALQIQEDRDKASAEVKCVAVECK